MKNDRGEKFISRQMEMKVRQCVFRSDHSTGDGASSVCKYNFVNISIQKTKQNKQKKNYLFL